MKRWFSRVDDLFRSSVESNVKEEEVDEDIFYELMEEMRCSVPKVLDKDVKKVLRALDEVLGKVPEELLDDFVFSENYELYKKVMKKAHEPIKTDKDMVNKVEKVLVLLERRVITANEARKMLGLPVRRIKPKEIPSQTKGEVLGKLKELRYEED